MLEVICKLVNRLSFLHGNLVWSDVWSIRCEPWSRFLAELCAEQRSWLTARSTATPWRTAMNSLRGWKRLTCLGVEIVAHCDYLFIRCLSKFSYLLTYLLTYQVSPSVIYYRFFLFQVSTYLTICGLMLISQISATFLWNTMKRKLYDLDLVTLLSDVLMNDEDDYYFLWRQPKCGIDFFVDDRIDNVPV